MRPAYAAMTASPRCYAPLPRKRPSCAAWSTHCLRVCDQTCASAYEVIFFVVQWHWTSRMQTAVFEFGWGDDSRSSALPSPSRWIRQQYRAPSCLLARFGLVRSRPGSVELRSVSTALWWWTQTRRSGPAPAAWHQLQPLQWTAAQSPLPGLLQELLVPQQQLLAPVLHQIRLY